MSSEAPCRSGVASFTSRKVVTAKRALSVVTSQAALTATGRVMIKRLRCSDLPPLRLARTNVVTFVARHLLVLRMTKADTERRHHHRRARIAAQLMTCAAGRNIASTRLRARRVTAEARRMRIEVGRNRHGHAAARGFMTSHAVNTAHADVPRVIEFHSETNQPRRKRFHRS